MTRHRSMHAANRVVLQLVSILLLCSCVEAGAPYDHVLAQPAETDELWWSLKPLAKPKPPTLQSTQNLAWAQTPIDRFILAKLLEKGLAPLGPADKHTWLRRVTFDLIGLPPTMPELAAFLADSSPQAYEHVVNRLLASPHYGERWARHWMDVVHYARRTAMTRTGRAPTPGPIVIISFARLTRTSRMPALSRSNWRAMCFSPTILTRLSPWGFWPRVRGMKARCATSARTPSTAKLPATWTATIW